jgi:hypothetical protein
MITGWIGSTIFNDGKNAMLQELPPINPTRTCFQELLPINPAITRLDCTFVKWVAYDVAQAVLRIDEAATELPRDYVGVGRRRVC